MKRVDVVAKALELAEWDEFMGICAACGSEVEGVEGDAHNLTCEECGAPQVYGVEEAVLMFG